MKKLTVRFLPLLLLVTLLMSSCLAVLPQGTPDVTESKWELGTKPPVTTADSAGSNAPNDPNAPNTPFSLDLVPAFDKKDPHPYAVINNNVPYFTEEEITTESFEHYSELDSLGRCGVATACIGTDLMPKEGEKRGDISKVTPTGWVQGKYDSKLVPGGWLYNRSHLIGWQLTAENANKLNLITGTKYLNNYGMLPFENQVADYLKEETENHVMYRVTPVFEGNNLLAEGVLMEAMSVEDDGDGILFCIWCYNVQPGVLIEYTDGSNQADNTAATVAYIYDPKAFLLCLLLL